MELLQDLLKYLKVRKKYWLLPVLIFIFFISFVVFFSQTASYTFIYTVF